MLDEADTLPDLPDFARSNFTRLGCSGFYLERVALLLYTPARFRKVEKTGMFLNVRRGL